MPFELVSIDLNRSEAVFRRPVAEQSWSPEPTPKVMGCCVEIVDSIEIIRP
jgi:hypothetical protein